MKHFFYLLVASLILCFSNSYATTHIVTIANGNNPWTPTTAGSFAKAMNDAKTTGDTIIFDYNSLGNSPTIILEAGFQNVQGLGGFVIDGLRGLPIGSNLPKIQNNAASGSGFSIIRIEQPNTTLIGLDFGPTAANGIFIKNSNITIDSCYFHDANYHGINISNTSSDVTIKNSLIFNNNITGQTTPEHAGIYSQGTRTIVDSCYIYGNGCNGVMIDGAAASDSKVINTVIGRDNIGTETGNGWNGVFVRTAANALIENNITVNNGKTGNNPAFISGIRFQQTSSGAINNNYIGTDPFKLPAGNAFDGITLHTSVSNITTTNNIICYNGFTSSFGNGGGLAVRSSPNNTIASNFIGAHPDLTDGGNNDYGISIENSANTLIGGNTPVEGNYIGFQKDRGIWLSFTTTVNTEVYNNNIVNNAGAGIQITSQTNSSIVGGVGKGNVLGFNQYGILVENANTTNNTLRYNSFSCNTVQGISLQNNGNNEYGNPNIVYPKEILVNTSEPRANFVSGLAPSSEATIDIYVADNNCGAIACDNNVNQGATWVASVTASSTPNSKGLYFWEYDITPPSAITKDNVVVLATESGATGAVNTSEFSICANLCNIPINATINSTDLNLCDGESTILTANSEGKDDTEGYSYNWYLDGTKIDYAIDDSTINATQAGVYTVVISSQLDSASCSDTTTTATLVVNQLPTFSLTTSANAICDGDSVLLVTETSGANLDIVWKPGNQTTDSIYVSTDGTFRVIVTNTVTSCIDSADVDIDVNQLPTVNLTASANTICDGDSVLLNAGTSGADLDIVWTPENKTGNSIYVNTDNTYKVVVTNTVTNCKDSASMTILVNQLPDFTLSASTNTFCDGDSVLLVAETSSANLDIFWKPGNQTIDSIYVKTGEEFKVIVTNTVTTCKDSATTSITKSPLPTLLLTAPFFCQGDETTVDAGISGMDYKWIPSGNTTQSFTVTAELMHKVTVTDPSTNCSATDSILADQSPDPKPTVSLSTLPENDTICLLQGETVDITATIGTTNDPGTLKWNNGTMGDLTITAIDTIEYIATYSDQYQCTDSDTIKINQLCIPPDPTLPNIVTVSQPWVPFGEITPEQVIKSSFVVYDRWGLKMFTTEDILPTWKGFNERDQQCSAGVYFWIWEYTDVTNTTYKYNGFMQLIH